MTDQPSNSIPTDRPLPSFDAPTTDASTYVPPTVPPLPAENVDPIYSLDLEPTQVDPFASRGAGYPDFSFADQSSTQPIPDVVDPNPFAAPSNYAQPTVPATPPPTAVSDFSLTEPTSIVGVPAVDASRTPATYQPYPAPAPLSDPVRYDYGYAAQPVVDHPNALPSLLLGIGSLVIFTPLGIVGLILAQKGRREVAANPGRWTSGGTLTAGYVLSIIGTILTALMVVFFLVFILIMFAAAVGS